jgi:hypothetical protein
MADPNVPLPLLPAHIQETVRSIARLHAEHQQNVTPLQLGRPQFMASSPYRTFGANLLRLSRCRFQVERLDIFILFSIRSAIVRSRKSRQVKRSEGFDIIDERYLLESPRE